MDGAGDEGGSPDPMRGWPTGDGSEWAEMAEAKGGRLRRRSAETRRQAADLAPPATPIPGSGPEEAASDVWSTLTAITQRIDGLSDITRGFRADVDKSFADLASGVTEGREQTKREVDDTLARSLETTSTELHARFQDDLENLTTTLSEALGQVAAHLERLSLLCGDNRDAVDRATEAIKATSSRLDELRPPPPPDLIPLTDTITRVADLVEALAHRIG